MEYSSSPSSDASEAAESDAEGLLAREVGSVSGQVSSQAQYVHEDMTDELDESGESRSQVSKSSRKLGVVSKMGRLVMSVGLGKKRGVGSRCAEWHRDRWVGSEDDLVGTEKAFRRRWRRGIVAVVEKLGGGLVRAGER